MQSIERLSPGTVMQQVDNAGKRCYKLLHVNIDEAKNLSEDIHDDHYLSAETISSPSDEFNKTAESVRTNADEHCPDSVDSGTVTDIVKSTTTVASLLYANPLAGGRKMYWKRKLSLAGMLTNDYMRTPLYNSFSPLMFSLWLAGLHYSRRVNSFGTFQKLPTISQVYCWTVTSAIWAVTLGALFSLRLVKRFGPSLLTNLSLFIWLLLCALNATNFLNASHSPKSKRKFFLGFSQLSGGHLMCPVRMNRMIFIGTVISWFLVAFNVSLLGFLTFNTPFLDSLFEPLLTFHPAAHLVSKGVFMILAFYLSCAWVFPSTLELSMSFLIYSEFKLFRKSFSAKISDDGVYAGSLEVDRRRFLEMVNIVTAADRCLSLHHGAAFSCNIVNFCLILYCMAYYPSLMQITTAVTAFAFWLQACILDIAVVCISGILVNSSVSIGLTDAGV